MYIFLFWLLAWLGKPFGGVRPRRIQHWLARKAYQAVPRKEDFRWYRDRAGFELLLHPHYFIDYSIIAFGEFEPSVLRYIDTNVKRGMVCLDVGANIGLMSLHLSKAVGSDGYVHCFEPVPHIFERLKGNVERNGLSSTTHLHQTALSNNTGRVAMAIAGSDAPNQGMGSIVSPCGREQLVEKIEISTETLDEFVVREQLSRLDFMKVDIQGAEPLLLEGGTETLTRFRPAILMEVAPEELVAIGRTSRDLVAQVENLGYVLFSIDERGRPKTRVQVEDVSAHYQDAGLLCLPRERVSDSGWENSGAKAWVSH